MDNTENKTPEFIENSHLLLAIAEEKFYREYAEKIADTLQARHDLTPEQYGYWFGVAQMMILIWRDRSQKLMDFKADLDARIKDSEVKPEIGNSTTPPETSLSARTSSDEDFSDLISLDTSTIH